MQYWRLLWLTFFYSFGQQICSGSFQHRIRNYKSLRRSIRDASAAAPSLSHTYGGTGVGAPLPLRTSESMQEMARTFSTASLSKYLSPKIKTSQYTYKKPRPKFRPVYSNRRKLVTSSTSSTNVEKQNATKTYKRNYKQDLKKKLMKSLLEDQPNKPSMFTRIYSFFSGIEPSELMKRIDNLDDYPATSSDPKDETGLSVVPDAQERTGLVLASTVGLMQAFFVVSTSVGLGSVLMMILALLVKLVIKGVLAAAITIYLL